MAPYTGPDGVPGALDYMSFSTALYGESDLWASGVLTWDSQPTCFHHGHSHRRPSLLCYCAHVFVRLWPYLLFCLLPTSPPFLLLLHLHLLCICFSCKAAALQVYTEGEREKKVSVFIFLSLFFFIKWIKLTYFIILNNKRYFSSPDWK